MIEIFDENGEVMEYLTAAERLPKFLEDFGPDSGYGITSDTEFVGDKGGVVFKASLMRLSDSAVVAQATAFRMMNGSAVQNRVWECGETAALQRLMARMGYGSENLMADEHADMTMRGTQFSDADSAVTTSGEGESADEAGDSADSADPAPAAATPPGVSPDKMRQLRNMAANKGVDVPEVTSNADASKKLKALRDLPKTGAEASAEA